MPRRPQGAIPLIELDPDGRVPLYRQLADGLRRAILSRRLVGGARLPSTRSLADDLGVSRSTVVAAFEQLNAEGYLRSVRGSGTTVPDDLPARRTGAVSLPRSGEAPPLEEPASPPPPRPFRPGVPALDEFASGSFGKLLRRVWRELDPRLLTAGPVAGDPALRAAVARHLRGSRKVRCTPDDVLITSGSQEGLALTFDLLAEAGEPVLMEDPGYVGAHRAIEAAGARALPVPVDADGMVVRAAPEHRPPARIAYVTPSHQFPTCVTLSLARRLELLEWASTGEGWIVEDDYDSEFRLQGRPLPSLQGLDERGRVVYVGTFSKSLAPGLRLGYLVPPRELRAPMLKLKTARFGVTSPWVQRAVAHFMDEGHFARHIRRTRALYRTRQGALSAAVARHLNGLAELRQPTGAMHGVLDLAGDADAKAIARQAGERGIEVIPLSWFSLTDERTEPALVLGFAGWTTEEIDAAIEELAQVIAGATDQASR